MKNIIFLLFLSTTALFAHELKVIAFAQDTMANDYRRAQVEQTREAAKQYPQFRFVYSDAKGKTSLLIYQIEQFIQQKVALLIVGTNDADAVVPVLSKAHKAGIPVIILDRGVNTKNYTIFINSDNIKIGEIGAEYIVKELHGKGTVLLFEGLQNADVTQLRTKGFMNVASQYKNIKVMKRTGNYLRRDAILEMEKLISEGVHIDAIFSESDSMLSGVRIAMQQHGIDPANTIMIGCDYTSEAREAIQNSKQTGSVKFPLAGKEAIEYAVKILQGKKVPHHVFIPVELVTKENVNAVAPVF